MSQFKLIEVKSEDKKRYFIEGYVSTTDPDFVNDIVDDLGQQATYDQIIGKNITMDEDHSEWRDPKTGKLYDGKKDKYPLAKIIETKLDSIGTWVKAELNTYHPDFNDRILPMISDKFLHSFSIAYKVTKAFDKFINNVKYRIIQGLDIANIGMTGNPVNKNATFNVALKSFNKMAEETQIKELETLNAELKSKVESLESELKESKEETLSLKSKIEEVTVSNETATAEVAELKSVSTKVDDLASQLETLQKENAELKSFVESPQLKSIVEGKSKSPQGKTEKVTMWDAC